LYHKDLDRFQVPCTSLRDNTGQVKVIAQVKGDVGDVGHQITKRGIVHRALNAIGVTREVTSHVIVR
jgi:hypothetical protein